MLMRKRIAFFDELKQTTVLSIGHRPDLAVYHTRTLQSRTPTPFETCGSTMLPDATEFVPTSFLLQRVHNAAPADHFTLGWVMNSLHASARFFC